MSVYTENTGTTDWKSYPITPFNPIWKLAVCLCHVLGAHKCIHATASETKIRECAFDLSVEILKWPEDDSELDDAIRKGLAAQIKRNVTTQVYTHCSTTQLLAGNFKSLLTEDEADEYLGFELGRSLNWPYNLVDKDSREKLHCDAAQDDSHNH
eukprot:1316678-Rhodomonas_salina.1